METRIAEKFETSYDDQDAVKATFVAALKEAAESAGSKNKSYNTIKVTIQLKTGTEEPDGSFKIPVEYTFAKGTSNQTRKTEINAKTDIKKDAAPITLTITVDKNTGVVAVA